MVDAITSHLIVFIESEIIPIMVSRWSSITVAPAPHFQDILNQTAQLYIIGGLFRRTLAVFATKPVTWNKE